MTERHADVVIVGFGGAGATAAITAHDAGAKVLVLEKMPEGGGSTRESAGNIRILADVARSVEHYHASTLGTTPRAVLQAFAEGVPELPGWLQQMGGQIGTYTPVTGFPPVAMGTVFPGLPQADALGSRFCMRLESGATAGEALWQLLHRQVQQRGIEVICGARVERLVPAVPGREVTGVLVQTAEGPLTVHARRAVILTCGGFNYGHDLQRQHWGFELPAFSAPGRNTGDGVRMAQAAGADVWHMNVVATSFGFKFPEHEAAFRMRMPAAGFFFVDQDGKRFVNESALELHNAALAALTFDAIDGRLSRLPSYVIFDDRTRRAGGVARLGIGHNRTLRWSDDNSEELARGWITAAPTLAELARRLGLPAEQVEQTAQRYNAGCAAGQDDFERKPAELAAVVEAPFCGVAIWPCLFNTQGGPRRNERAEVVDPFGHPIPRLFAAGELGSIWGVLYPGTENISEALIFGRIAGRNAAAQSPRTA